MKEEQQAFYVLKSKHPSVISAFENGCVNDIRICTFVQKAGRNAGYHGSDLYETITEIKDSETGEMFSHSSFDERNAVDYVPVRNLESELGKALRSSGYRSLELERMMNEEKLKQARLQEIMEIFHNEGYVFGEEEKEQQHVMGS